MGSFGTTEIIIILAFLAIPLLLIAVVVFVVKNSRGNLKKCPYCAESIQPEAIVCRFCGRDLR